MTDFVQAKRANSTIIAGIAGPSGGGKTYSALRFATGLADGGKIVAIDTERGRMLHYADEFDFLYAELDAPFSPDRWAEAIKSALRLEPAVVILDSFSHEWAGDGGVLDMQEADFQRRGGRESAKVASWIEPKKKHKTLINDVLIRMPCHLVICLRAEDKIEMKKNADGKLEVVPKKTLSGHVGWIPVTGKEIPYELTLNLVVTPDAPGVPKPIKLMAQHRALVPLDRPLDEETGSRLAAWAKGSGAAANGSRSAVAAGEPAPDDTGAPTPSSPSGVPATEPQNSSDQKPTPGQRKKLGVLVVTLRDKAGVITTENLWVALANARKVEVDVMIELLAGRDDAGELHFGPLLADLTRVEASDLIERLERLERNTPKAAA
jgi:hypothetical protein